MSEETPKTPSPKRLIAVIIVASSAIVSLLLGLLLVSIMERRWEAERPALVLKPIADYEPDNSVWGQNYPREYETYLQTKDASTHTKFGGSFPRDYLEDDANLVVLFAGYGFSKDYKQARGHYYAVEDVTKTKRIKTPYNPGTCWSCKSTDVPRLMDKMGPAAFYAANWHDLKKEITHPIGCQDCHDPKTMNLRITRPALREAFAAQGKNIDDATHQEMRSLVCAQCHVEYYFAKEPKNYLTFPWKKGKTVEDIIAYYDEQDFTDWVHPISKTPIIKAQHPDFEMYSTGVHAYQNVACADCHMPYKSEGGLKFTNHHVQSPLLNIAGSCNVCHRWSEQEIKDRVESIQTKVYNTRLIAESALVRAHFDVAAAVEAGIDDASLKEAGTRIRHGQFRWDYVAANNGMGFHAPQETMRILADSINDAKEASILVGRLLAAKGIPTPSQTPDVSTRQLAWDESHLFVEKTPPKLLAPISAPDVNAVAPIPSAP
jgi:nitrite reductase (cytochrome c-552)